MLQQISERDEWLKAQSLPEMKEIFGMIKRAKLHYRHQKNAVPKLLKDSEEFYELVYEDVCRAKRNMA